MQCIYDIATAACLPGDEDTSVPSTSNVISVENDDAFEMQSTSEASSEYNIVIDSQLMEPAVTETGLLLYVGVSIKICAATPQNRQLLGC